MINISIEELASELCRKSDLGDYDKIEILEGGRNNKVFKLFVGEKKYLLKKYFFSELDKRDRLNNEYSFLVFAEESNCKVVPKPIYRDDINKAAIYEFIEGKNIDNNKINENDIMVASSFIKSINRSKYNARQILPNAVDSGFSFQEHINITEARIDRLNNIIANDDFTKVLRDKIDKEIIPLWIEVKNRLLTLVTKNSSYSISLTKDECWVSPSDFGFHNTLRKKNGDIIFLDFEFAGWDDPAKLICDFLNQPDNILSNNFAEIFIRSLLDGDVYSKDISTRVVYLTPLFQIKWICIILNIFQPVGLERNVFLEKEITNQQKEKQLEKMGIMYDRAIMSFKNLK